MDRRKITVVVDTADATELGEALLDAVHGTAVSGLSHSIGWVRGRAVAIPLDRPPCDYDDDLDLNVIVI